MLQSLIERGYDSRFYSLQTMEFDIHHPFENGHLAVDTNMPHTPKLL